MRRAPAACVLAGSVLLAAPSALAQAQPPPVAPARGYPDGFPQGYPGAYPQVYVADPLPPPPPTSPRTALWVGARVGYEAPIASAFTSGTGARYSERSLIGPGPSLEVDVGGRFGRRFLPYFYVSRLLGSAGSTSEVPPALLIAGTPVDPRAGPVSARVSSSSTTVLGVGLRHAFGTDDVGFTLELVYGYRITRVTFADGSRLRADAAGEFKLGIGVDLRLSPTFSLSPMAYLGLGSYGDVTIEGPTTPEKNAQVGTETHGYVGLGLGGHFDLFGRL